MLVACSWSGGKDSCFACYKAMGEGLTLCSLLTMVSREYQRSGSHGIRRELLYRQSEAIGIPMLQKEFTRESDELGYERVFKEALRELKQRGAEGFVTGDIYLQENRDWVERVCRESGVQPIMPLWGVDTSEAISQFAHAGFEAILVTAKADLLNEDWLGRKIDRRFVREIHNLGRVKSVDPCGEAGEFHTFVTNGPLFKGEIKILETEKVLRNGYWFLDILRYEVGEKGHVP